MTPVIWPLTPDHTHKKLIILYVQSTSSPHNHAWFLLVCLRLFVEEEDAQSNPIREPCVKDVTSILPYSMSNGALLGSKVILTWPIDPIKIIPSFSHVPLVCSLQHKDDPVSQQPKGRTTKQNAFHSSRENSSNKFLCELFSDLSLISYQ